MTGHPTGNAAVTLAEKGQSVFQCMKFAVLALAASLAFVLPAGSSASESFPRAPEDGFGNADFPCESLPGPQYVVACSFSLPDSSHSFGLVEKPGGGYMALHRAPVGIPVPVERGHVVFSAEAVEFLRGDSDVEYGEFYVVRDGSEPRLVDGGFHRHTFALQGKSLTECIEDCAVDTLVGVGFFELICIVALIALAVASGGTATPAIIALAESCATAPLSAFIAFAACIARCECLKAIGVK